MVSGKGESKRYIPDVKFRLSWQVIQPKAFILPGFRSHSPGRTRLRGGRCKAGSQRNKKTQAALLKERGKKKSLVWASIMAAVPKEGISGRLRSEVKRVFSCGIVPQEQSGCIFLDLGL